MFIEPFHTRLSYDALPDRKGIGLIFPNPDVEIGPLAGVQCGDANEPGDVGAGPGKSSLFFVRDSGAWNRIDRR